MSILDAQRAAFVKALTEQLDYTFLGQPLIFDLNQWRGVTASAQPKPKEKQMPLTELEKSELKTAQLRGNLASKLEAFSQVDETFAVSPTSIHVLHHGESRENQIWITADDLTDEDRDAISSVLRRAVCRRTAEIRKELGLSS